MDEKPIDRRRSMDEDLQALAVLLDKPDPSGYVFDVGWRRLLNQIRREVAPPAAGLGGSPRGRRRRTSWRVGVIAMAAAAAAVTVAVTVPTHVPARRLAVAPPRSASAQQILLAAAVTASRQYSGRYWHFEEQDSFATRPGASSIYQDWITRTNETVWNWQPPCGPIPAGVIRNGPGMSPPDGIGNVTLTWQVMSHLPTRPAALYAWLAYHDHFVVAGPPTPVPVTSHIPTRYHYVPMSDAAVREQVASMLISLEWELPAPSALRVAAFRTLATFPSLAKLGPAEGGQELLIAFPGQPRYTWIKLIIDPATAQLRSVSNGKGITQILIAQWANRLPRIVPLDTQAGCGGSPGNHRS
jgi:hypothetical protein